MVVLNKAPFFRCAITDLSKLKTPDQRRLRLREQVRRWALDGIDLVQLREKQLAGGELLGLAEAAMEVLHELTITRETVSGTRLLVNGRPDVAVAGMADGVQLTARSGEIRTGQVRHIFAWSGAPACFVAVSCHTVQEVISARRSGADLILFGPVFEKRVGREVVAEGLGLRRLSEACEMAGSVKVLAVGGVTEGNAPSCLSAGAAGIAGIRLFARREKIEA